MSTTTTEMVECPACENEQSLLVVESANVQRLPAFREQILARTFMRFTCLECSHLFIVERPVLYTDFDARLFVGVFPQPARNHSDHLAEIVEAAYQQSFEREPPVVVRAALGHLQRRVVFGYEELREKVLCFGGGLDDRVLEALKLAILGQSPMLGPLVLQAADNNSLSFFNLSGSDVTVDRRVYQELWADVERLKLLLPALWSNLYVSAERCAKE